MYLFLKPWFYFVVSQNFIFIVFSEFVMLILNKYSSACLWLTKVKTIDHYFSSSCYVFAFSVVLLVIIKKFCFLLLSPIFSSSAGGLSQVPPGSDSDTGSLPHWHEEGASAGSHRHDGTLRPFGSGGETAKDWKEKNPRWKYNIMLS